MSEPKITVKVGLQIALPIFAAVVFALSAYGAARVQISGNTTRIEMQEKQIERVLLKLDKIENLLLLQAKRK